MSTLSMYARTFDRNCPAWSPDRENNLMFLRYMQHYCNDLLKLKGKVYLSDVYEKLGFPVDQASRMVGWRYFEDNTSGDNYIDFGLFDLEISDDSIVLDFNVDGII